MGIKPFRTINAKDPDLMRVQDSIRDTFASIVRVALLNGNAVEAVLGTSPVEVSHGLNRPILGWFIVRQNAQAAVWEPSASDTPSKTLRLEASAAVTVTITFF
jgi:hypothetical protein